MFCKNCGKEIADNSVHCDGCGAPAGVTANAAPEATIPQGYEQKSKMAAGLLGIFLGAWGVHNFYLGNTNRGILQIVLTVVTCGIAGLWGFIEGIMILAGNIKVDAKGVPLKD